MKHFDGKLVNNDWYVLLSNARRHGRSFHLNSGKRTLAEQIRLFAQNMYGPGRPRPNHPLTAVPNPRAPHIRPNHACDIGYNNSNTQQVIDFGHAHGVPLQRTVSTEFWHIEDVSGGRGLRLYARRNSRPVFRVIRRGARGPRVWWIQRALRLLGYFKAIPTGFVGSKTVVALKRFQSRHGLANDGVYGQKTSVALHAAVKNYKRSH